MLQLQAYAWQEAQEVKITNNIWYFFKFSKERFEDNVLQVSRWSNVFWI